jgi:hypothetical protein
MVPSAIRIDLDDSRVLVIKRESGVVTIELEQSRGSITRRFLVVASDVTQENAEYYIGHNVTASHPDPALPLDYIEFAEQGPGYLELGGYKHNESWFVWRIASSNIQVVEGQSTGSAT